MRISARQSPHLAELARSVEALWTPAARREGTRPDGAYAFHQNIYAGIETRTDPKTYHWDGLTRRSDATHPQIVFQYTLDGCGEYADASGTRRLEPGMAFAAVIPGPHRYYLPASSARWHFFWIMFQHDYIARRIAARQKDAGAVWNIDPESLLVATSLRLIESATRKTLHDPLDAERLLFEFLIEYERFGHALLHPVDAREKLLADVRGFVTSHLADQLDVAKLAARHQMSRSAYTHFFVDRTGKSPAAFVTELRLDEVSRRLLQTDQTLQTIAHDTGFADANHLCKVFRRKYHLSPGAFRKQMR